MVSGRRRSSADRKGLLTPYDIVQTANGTLVAEFFFTSRSPLGVNDSAE